jgi:hypothetical protein
MRADRSLEQHLRGLEEQLLQPGIRKFAEEVAALLDDDFVEFGGSGRIFDKQQVVEALRAESPVRLSLTDFKAVLLAPDVALAPYRAIRYGDSAEPPIHSLRSSIWKLVEDRWLMVFHQGTPTGEA